MRTGTVKNFFEKKGFGFIEAIGDIDGERDVFFHVSQWQSLGNLPAKGDQVTFTVGTDPRSGRPRAESVALA